MKKGKKIEKRISTALLFVLLPSIVFLIPACFRSESPKKSRHPTHSFRMSTLDPARFGQLYLNKGTWDGNRIVPAQWIQESISVTPLPDQRGDPYGYL